MQTTTPEIIEQVASTVTELKTRDIAIALDFDGVCKLFTNHKHQIMSTCLFLNVREFQRVPFEEFRDAYVYINFRSPDYAGKERFLCACALSEHLAKEGHNCRLPEISDAVAQLRSAGLKINEKNLKPYMDRNQVQRFVAWSHEVNKNLERLTEIGLTPGIRENIFDKFESKTDFFVVSTATEDSIRSSLEKESIGFIKEYFGQETCTKAEALTGMARVGYRHVVMFGDSVEDTRASDTASELSDPPERVMFNPVIPGAEQMCFERGRLLVEALLDNKTEEALRISDELRGLFQGREAGSGCSAPLSLDQK